MIFIWSGKSISHFQKQGEIHIDQKNNKFPVKLLKL